MKHYIIVKFNDDCDKEKLYGPIKELFNKSLEIEGVNGLDVYTSCIDLPNRYDLMIKMDLSLEALREFDSSEIHKKWKEEFGSYIESKTIFDCEE